MQLNEARHDLSRSHVRESEPELDDPLLAILARAVREWSGARDRSTSPFITSTLCLASHLCNFCRLTPKRSASSVIVYRPLRYVSMNAVDLAPDR